MTWCILLHTYTYESRSRTPKRIRIYSVIYYIIHIHIIIRCNTSPGGRVICHKRRRLAASLPRVFFHSRTHPKTTGLLQLLIFSHPSFSFSFLRYFLVVSNTSLGKEKTNKKHAASLFQRGYDSRRERESEAGERGAIEREANGTSSFDFFFSLNSLSSSLLLSFLID